MTDRSTDNLIRLREVKRRTGLSTPTIYRMVAKGTFPEKIRLSEGIVAWYESDVSRWVADPLGWSAAA